MKRSLRRGCNLGLLARVGIDAPSMKRSLRRGCNVQGLRHAEQAEALNEAQPPERLQPGVHVQVPSS